MDKATRSNKIWEIALTHPHLTHTLISIPGHHPGRVFFAL